MKSRRRNTQRRTRPVGSEKGKRYNTAPPQRERSSLNYSPILDATPRPLHLNTDRSSALGPLHASFTLSVRNGAPFSPPKRYHCTLFHARLARAGK